MDERFMYDWMNEKIVWINEGNVAGLKGSFYPIIYKQVFSDW